VDAILNSISIGVDIGKITDPTAISIAEVVRVETGRYRACKPVPAHIDIKTGQFVKARDAEPVMRTRFIIRQIGRLALGTSYPDVAEKIVGMLCDDRFAGRRVRMLIDVTGVGQAIYDMVRKGISEQINGINDLTLAQKEQLKRVSLQPISFVHGEKYNRSRGTLGKSFLVSKMQALLQYRRVDLPATDEAKATCDELLVYETRINDKGNDQYGAKTGAHDDLATALCLSCLEDPYALQVTNSERIY
jgi:hypothetical protein